MELKDFKITRCLLSFGAMSDLLSLADYVGDANDVFAPGEQVVIKWCTISDGILDIYAVLKLDNIAVVELGALAEMDILLDNMPMVRLERAGGRIFLSDDAGVLREVEFAEFEEFAATHYVAVQ